MDRSKATAAKSMARPPQAVKAETCEDMEDTLPMGLPSRDSLQIDAASAENQATDAVAALAISDTQRHMLAAASASTGLSMAQLMAVVSAMSQATSAQLERHAAMARQGTQLTSASTDSLLEATLMAQAVSPQQAEPEARLTSTRVAH